jgi:glycosyltransferase involved in cell wall biosynthesis
MHPFYGSRLGKAANDWLLSTLVRRELGRHGMAAPILVTTVPNVAGLVDHLGERASVYYRVDDFGTWPGYEAATVRRLEEELLDRVDAVAFTASALDPRPRRPWVNALHLPHGVDLDLFARGGPEPPAMAAIPRPRLLSLGLFDERIDVRLLDAVAGAKPDWHIVLVGRRTAPPCAADQRPNVHVMPQVAYAEVPRWLAAADLLLIPYVRSDQTDTINPLKLREFLASGTPIVATALPEVVRLASDLVPTADDPRRFLDAAEQALGRAAEAEQRRARVLQDSWQARAGELLDFLEPLLGSGA